MVICSYCQRRTLNVMHVKAALNLDNNKGYWEFDLVWTEFFLESMVDWKCGILNEYVWFW